MKKLIILSIALTAFVGSITAQSNYIDGVWKLTEMKEADEVYPVNMHVVFNEAGEINISGANVGTWSQNETENTFTISCPYLGILEGENKIEALNDSELKLSNANGDVNSFQKISLPKNKELHNKITGDWFFEKMDRKGETNFVGSLVEFNKNGIFYWQDMVLGTWNYNESSKKIILDNKDFKGEYSFSQPDKNELVLNLDEDNMYFSKIDKQKIINDNKESGLIGTWEFKDIPYSGSKTIISFNEPDEFKIIQKEEGMTSTFGGVWISNKKEMSLMIIGLRGGDAFSGKNKILKIDGETIELENRETIYKGTKKVEKPQTIEHLSIIEDEFYNEDGSYKYEVDQEKLPSWNWSEMKNNILDVTQLVYNYSTLIEGTESFDTKILTANVHASLEEDGFEIDNVFNGYDNTESDLPINHNFSSPLYPLEETIYRVTGSEQITTPAGTFECMVIEVVNYSGVLKKLWMISDKIGIYAKIIEEDTDETFGHYYIYELQEIKL
jgi:hypothetical protein